MDLGLTLLIIGALLVFGAKLFSKMIKWIIKVFGFLVVIVGILFIFDLI